MKILIALLMAASLMACGKKKNPSTPTPMTGDQSATPASTGGSSYGGANQTPTPPTPATPPEGTTPAGGQ